MSLAKAVLSGSVYRNPQKRFTGNDIAVTSLTLNLDDKDQSLIRVVARGNLAENLENAVSEGDRIVVEGRLQISTFQNDDGTQKKVTELDLSSFEVLSSSSTPGVAQSQSKVVEKFAEVEAEDVLIGEEEIPF